MSWREKVEEARIYIRAIRESQSQRSSSPPPPPPAFPLKHRSYVGLRGLSYPSQQPVDCQLEDARDSDVALGFRSRRTRLYLVTMAELRSVLTSLLYSQGLGQFCREVVLYATIARFAEDYTSLVQLEDTETLRAAASLSRLRHIPLEIEIAREEYGPPTNKKIIPSSELFGFLYSLEDAKASRPNTSESDSFLREQGGTTRGQQPLQVPSPERSATIPADFHRASHHTPSVDDIPRESLTALEVNPSGMDPKSRHIGNLSQDKPVATRGSTADDLLRLKEEFSSPKTPPMPKSPVFRSPIPSQPSSSHRLSPDSRYLEDLPNSPHPSILPLHEYCQSHITPIPDRKKLSLMQNTEGVPSTSLPLLSPIPSRVSTSVTSADRRPHPSSSRTKLQEQKHGSAEGQRSAVPTTSIDSGYHRTPLRNHSLEFSPLPMQEDGQSPQSRHPYHPQPVAPMGAWPPFYPPYWPPWPVYAPPEAFSQPPLYPPPFSPPPAQYPNPWMVHKNERADTAWPTGVGVTPFTPDPSSPSGAAGGYTRASTQHSSTHETALKSSDADGATRKLRQWTENDGSEAAHGKPFPATSAAPESCGQAVDAPKPPRSPTSSSPARLSPSTPRMGTQQRTEVPTQNPGHGEQQQQASGSSRPAATPTSSKEPHATNPSSSSEPPTKPRDAPIAPSGDDRDASKPSEVEEKGACQPSSQKVAPAESKAPGLAAGHSTTSTRFQDGATANATTKDDTAGPANDGRAVQDMLVKEPGSDNPAKSVTEPKATEAAVKRQAAREPQGDIRSEKSETSVIMLVKRRNR